MSVEIKCRSGKNKGKYVKLHSFEVVKGKRSRGDGFWYMIRGESTGCPHVLTKFTTEKFAKDWEKSTGKKVSNSPVNSNKQRKTRERTQRRRERKQRQKEKAKAKARRERERAKKAAAKK